MSEINIDRVEFTVGFTSNIGNYESIRTQVTLGGSIPQGADVDTAINIAYDKAEAVLVEKARAVADSLSPAAKRKTGINPD